MNMTMTTKGRNFVDLLYNYNNNPQKNQMKEEILQILLKEVSSKETWDEIFGSFGPLYYSEGTTNNYIEKMSINDKALLSRAIIIISEYEDFAAAPAIPVYIPGKDEYVDIILRILLKYVAYPTLEEAYHRMGYFLH